MYGRVYIEITNTCNLHCSFCHGTRRPHRRMTMAEFAHLADSLVGMTEYLYFHVLGEPLSHPLLTDFIAYAKARGFKVVLTTNGTLLPSVGDALIEAGVYKVNVSLHSFEGDDVARQQAYIAGCVDFVDRASGAGVLCILRLWNHLDEAGDAVAAIEANNRYAEQQLRVRFGDDWTMSARGARLRPKLHLEPGERFDWPDMALPDLGERVRCHGLGDHFAILVDGSVVPCCLDAEGTMTLGNAHDEDVREILEGPRATAIRAGFAACRATEPLCRRCPYARRFRV